jgi:hypothetical protein
VNAFWAAIVGVLVEVFSVGPAPVSVRTEKPASGGPVMAIPAVSAPVVLLMATMVISCVVLSTLA